MTMFLYWRDSLSHMESTNKLYAWAAPFCGRRCPFSARRSVFQQHTEISLQFSLGEKGIFSADERSRALWEGWHKQQRCVNEGISTVKYTYAS